MKKILYTIFLLVCFFKISAQVVDEKFKPSFLAAYSARVLEQQSDGKILIGFNGEAYLNTNPVKNMCRVSEDGAFDPSFKYPDIIATTPAFIEQLSDGKILIGGRFLGRDNKFLGNLLRLMPNGDLDTSFRSISDETLTLSRALLFPNQKILVVSSRLNGFGPPNLMLEMISPNGRIDTSFKAKILPTPVGATVSIAALAQQNLNQIIVAGSNISIGDVTRDVIRLDTLGNIDLAFDPKVTSVSNFKVSSLVLFPNTGAFAIRASDDNNFQWFDRDGRLIINRQLNSRYSRIYRLNDNAVFLAGSKSYLININGDVTPLTRLDFNFFLIDGFTQKDGRVLVSGLFTEIGQDFNAGLARFSSFGGSLQQDFSWNTGMYRDGSVRDLVVQKDGKIVVGGFFHLVNGERVNHIARLFPENGALDRSFNLRSANFNRSIFALDLFENGNLLVAAASNSSVFDAQLNGFQIFSPDGFNRQRLPFPYLGDGGLNDAKIDQLGQIYALDGAAGGPNGQFSQGFLRYTPQGQPDINFDAIYMDNLNYIHGFEILSNQKMLIFGNQLRYDKGDTTCLVRTHPNGQRDLRFNLNVNKLAVAIDVIPIDTNTTLIAGVDRLNDNRTAIPLLVKAGPNGRIDPNFQASFQSLPGNTASVNKIFQLPGNEVLVTGSFNAYNGNPVSNNSAVIDQSGRFKYDFLPNIGRATYSQVIQSTNNTYYLAGSFSLPNGAVSLAKIKSTTTPTRQVQANTQPKQARIFPNPVLNQELQLEIQEKWAGQALQYQILELGSGKALLNGSLAPGQNRSLVLPQSLLKGSYLLRLNNGEEQEGHVFLVTE
jgi:uncharacterized delta-60 repeat protein